MGLYSTIRFITGHPLNKGRPIAAIGRFVKWQIRSRINDEITVDWVDGTKLVVKRGMTGATGNVYCGLREFADMAFVIHLLRPGDLFVDIGANVGSYTVLASGVCGANTIAIEPASETIRSLERNIEVNGLNKLAVVRNTAAGSKSGFVRFTTGRGATNRVAEADETQAQLVRLSTLDNVVEGKAPTLIKIDVEGYELEVLKGARQCLLRPSLLAVISEDTGDQVAAVLLESGFDRFFYEPLGRTLTSVPTETRCLNSLYIRNVEEVRSRVRVSPKRLVNETEL